MRSPVRSMQLVALLLVAAGGTPAAEGPKESCHGFAATCLHDLIAREAKRGWLGAGLIHAEGRPGLAVARVSEGSPAAKAGLVAGDVIVAIDGLDIRKISEQELYDHTTGIRPGIAVTYTVDRGGSHVDVRMVPIQPSPALFYEMVVRHLAIEFPEAFKDIELPR